MKDAWKLQPVPFNFDLIAHDEKWVKPEPRAQVIRESKVTPPDLQEYLTSAGGLNWYGQPNFRLVWGWSRLCWLGARWPDGAVELREEPKYFFALNRWVVERWFPAEFFGSPASWKISTDVYEDESPWPIPGLGPYPSRGDWEHCFTIEDLNKQFVQATPQILRQVVQLMELSRILVDSERRDFKEERAAQAEKAAKQKDYATVGLEHEVDLAPVVRPFNEGNFVTVL